MESDTMLRQQPVAPERGDTDLHQQLRTMWAAVAPAWSEHAEYADTRGAEIAEKMLAVASPQPGDRVLELACGPGGLGLVAAERVKPGGSVVLSDLVAEMTSVAEARAAARGLTNVTTRQLDLEQIDEPDSSYDVVLCREGLQFAPDPARAAKEIVRVLRRRGRFAVAVWGPPAGNPWLSAVFAAVQAVTGKAVPPPGVPGPFSLSDRERLGNLFRDPPATEVSLSDFEVPVRAASFDEWWGRTCALAGPLARILRSMPDQAREAIRTHAREAVSGYETAGGIEIPGLALLVSGSRS